MMYINSLNCDHIDNVTATHREHIDAVFYNSFETTAHNMTCCQREPTQML